MTENRYAWLDVIRGLSALTVCAAHLRAAVFEDYGTLENAGYSDRLFYFLTSLGHQSVMVFFVLSGFFVGGSILSQGKRFQWRTYALARLSRLWVVLIPCLFLTLGIDLWFQACAPEIMQGAWQSMWRSGPNPDGSWSIGASRFLANLFFLQTIETPVYGSNTPLWSLANEFWYYVLFPLIVMTAKTDTPSRPRVICTVLIALLCYWLPMDMLALFSIWLLGAGVWWLTHREMDLRRQRLFLLFGTGLTLAALVLPQNTVFTVPYGLSRDLPLGISFAILLVGVTRLQTCHRAAHWITLAGRRLSDLSYSLYLCHLPIILAISRFFIGETQLRPSGSSYALFVGFLAILVFIAWLLWLLFERHTDFVRRRILDFMGDHSKKTVIIPASPQ